MLTTSICVCFLGLAFLLSFPGFSGEFRVIVVVVSSEKCFSPQGLATCRLVGACLSTCTCILEVNVW